MNVGIVVRVAVGSIKELETRRARQNWPSEAVFQTKEARFGKVI